MYETLIYHLRECAKADSSENTFTEAADAIKNQNELIKALSSSCEQRKRRICFLEWCIAGAIDALNRSTDNDLAIDYLEKAVDIIDDYLDVVDSLVDQQTDEREV